MDYHKIRNYGLGLLIVGVITALALYIAQFSFLKTNHISALLIGVLLGLIGSFIYPKYSHHMNNGVQLSAKKLLRLGVILYGFKVSVTEILSYGFSPLFIALFVVVAIFFMGVLLGNKLGLDKETSMLVSIGSAICGAAAVLALEGVLKSKPFKSIVAVGTVIVFGLFSMFLYPFVYHLGIIPLNPMQEGVYIGATLHEVANVVGAASSVSLEAEKIAITIKMVRVILLIPLLLGISLYLAKSNQNTEKTKIQIPWFAFMFLGMVILHSYLPLFTKGVINPQILEKTFETLRQISEICLIMAMSALGLQVDVKNFLSNGSKAFLLAFILFIGLVIGGLFLVKGLV
ncbi:YeiH family protein [Helicobacter cetorum]|uniref:Putative membrane protein YeiH n=1 Tax=Helicobacter cetorum (strain ATCC BAA-540 / CCUG 52418 / MIT 99-5656) TaxID=1163745 RepID=I0EQN8_HELCM|nr:YeiH family protein [Helicobacter cetorum]AFI05257.1 putative membrane protein YeiH [Helicobacter cetorum MIT 99-5656]